MRVESSGYGVYGFWVENLGIRNQGLGFGVHGLFRVQGLGFRVWGSGFQGTGAA